MADDVQHGIDRSYGAGISMGEAEARAERAARYDRDMRPVFDERLAEARSKLVAMYRGRAQAWPGAIDSKYDRWYRAEEWNDKGEYIGEPPCVKAANPDVGVVPAVTINTEAEKVEKLAAGRAVLVEAEDRLGVAPALTGETRKRGRPSVGEPWVAAGVSKAAWYRQHPVGKKDAET
jgi:hypothetical protein